MKRKKLPFSFDAERLKVEYESIPQSAFMDIYNPFVELEKLWRADLILPEPVPEMDRQPEFKPNELLLNRPGFLEVFETIQSPLETFRVHKLCSGAKIRKHRDIARNWENGVFRIHVPIITNEQVSTLHDGERVSFQPGECWYLDFDLEHEIHNDSPHERVHLIMDCVRNAWWEEVFAKG